MGTGGFVIGAPITDDAVQDHGTTAVATAARKSSRRENRFGSDVGYLSRNSSG